MNKILKKNLNRVLNRLYRVVKTKHRRGVIATGVSKAFVNTKNSVKYDEAFDMYWQVHGNTFLQIDQNPIYDFSYAKYEKRFKTMFCRKYDVKKGDVVIDLGAGIGAELPFYCSRLLNEGTVYAIEASRDSYTKMERLCKTNAYGDNVSLHHLAISDTAGTVWIEETDLYKANQINKSKKGIEVKAMTLDEFVDIHKITKINLLKMNIEGAELQVIKGMTTSVDLVDNFAISCHDFLFKEVTTIKETVKSFFEKNGFVVEEIQTGDKYIDSWIFGRRVKPLKVAEK